MGLRYVKGMWPTGPPWTSYDPAVPWQPAIPFSAIPRDSVVDPEKQTLLRFTQLATGSPSPTFRAGYSAMYLKAQPR